MADRGAVTSRRALGGAGKRPRRWFGTDGVRGVVGEALTAGARRAPRTRGDALVGPRARARRPRHARLGPGARGGAHARDRRRRRHGRPRRACCRRRPSRCSSQDLGLVVSASHNPPEYNGVKVFDREGHKLTDADELEIEALLGRARPRRRLGRGRRGRASRATSTTSSSTSAPTSAGCGSRSTARTARSRASRPASSSGSAREVTASPTQPDGTNINVGCGATDLAMLAGDRPRGRTTTSGSPSTATATGCSPWTRTGEVVDGDQIVAICALALGVDLVAVTAMTNLGFHRLMAEHGIRVVTTDVGDRYVLEALRREGGDARRRAVRAT